MLDAPFIFCSLVQYMPFDIIQLSLAKRLLQQLRERGDHLVTAESCTGGLIAALFTEIAGASDVFERGFVTYSNEAKHELLGLDPAILQQHGAVSEQTARAMALGALNNSNAQISVSVTGIAGPGGATPKKPVGTVFIASARTDGKVRVEHHTFPDEGRTAIRVASVTQALSLLEKMVAQTALRD